MEIHKSSRHSKITGDFSEHLVLYWLSKNGFECVRVDHTGIDLLARNPYTKELMGISVKSRSRNTGTEGEPINISDSDIQKALIACKTFGCIAYFAIVADIKDKIVIFILSSQKFASMCHKSSTVYTWKMTEKFLKQYYTDRDIKILELCYCTHSWW